MAKFETYVCYDENNEIVKYEKDGKEYNAIYYVRSVDEIKKYITFEIYNKTNYIQKYEYDKKTTRNEDGSFTDTKNWAINPRCKKHYIHNIW